MLPNHDPQPSLATLLPHPAPDRAQDKLILFVLRRMAVGGIGDAHAAHALLANFGLAHRRPLVLMRALMAEVARVAQRRLAIAPCCCHRSTADEAGMLAALGHATNMPDAAHRRLAGVVGTRTCLGVLASAQAVAAAFADLGYPLSADQ